MEKIKAILANGLNPLIESYKLAWRGEEKKWKVLALWGGVAIFVYIFFVKGIIIDRNPINFINIIIAVALLFYFLFHLILIRKSLGDEIKSAKEEKKARKLEMSSMTKEEKKNLKIESRKDFRKHLLKKLLLQESFSKWSWTKIIVLLDLYVIADIFLVILKGTKF